MVITSTAPAQRAKRHPLSNTSPVPLDFDPVQMPILAAHWYGAKPLRANGAIAAEVGSDLKFRRQVERLHCLGDRVLGEFLAELGAERGITTIIDQKLDTYTELDPETLEVTGGDGFWPLPVRKVEP